MNTLLKELAQTGIPKLENLNEKDKKKYQFGLLLLSSVVSDKFIDIPKLPQNRFDTDGLFYTIPYLDDETLWHSGNSRMLLVVWKVENRSSFCPLRIEVEIQDDQNFAIQVFDQSGEKTIKNSLISKENGQFFSEIKDYESVTLSQLFQNDGSHILRGN